MYGSYTSPISKYNHWVIEKWTTMAYKPSPDIFLISIPGLQCSELKTKPVEETDRIINMQSKSKEKDKLHPV